MSHHVPTGWPRSILIGSDAQSKSTGASEPQLPEHTEWGNRRLTVVSMEENAIVNNE